MNVGKAEAPLKLLIDGIEDLDPISVYLESWGSRGKITFTCWDAACSAFFGSMGSDLLSFISTCNADYIARKMVNGKLRVTDYEKIADDIGESEMAAEYILLPEYSEKLKNKYGDEYLLDLPTKEDDHFVYVRKVCEIIIKAVKQYQLAEAA